MQGQLITQSFTPVPLQGTYMEPAAFQRSFGMPGRSPNVTIAAREKITLWQDGQALVGRIDDSAYGLGGWTIDGQRLFEPNTGVLHAGASGQRTSDLQRNIIDRFAGGGSSPFFSEGAPARDARFNLAWAVAAAPDGSVFVVDFGRAIWRVLSNGSMVTSAGSTARVEGHPITNANALAVGPDEALYIAVGNMIVRWNTTSRSGTIFAGVPGSPFNENVDGIPARNAQLQSVEAMAFGPDGSLYLTGGSRIRRIAPDGMIYAVTGPTTLPRAINPEGRTALATNIGPAYGLTVGLDGTVHFTIDSSSGARVFAIPPSGIIQRFAT